MQLQRVTDLDRFESTKSSDTFIRRELIQSTSLLACLLLLSIAHTMPSDT